LGLLLQMADTLVRDGLIHEKEDCVMTMMKVLKPILILSVAVAVVAILIYIKPEPEVITPTVRPLLVEVLEVHPQRLSVSVKAQGMVQPARQTSLISEVRGRVVEVDPDFKPGGFFRSGAVMLRLDNRDYMARLDQARALVAQAKSALAQEKGRAYVAKQEWGRRAGKDGISRDAQRLALREPQLLEAQAQLDSALASFRLAEIELERTVIKAPYDGLVAGQEVDLGQFINAGTALGRFLGIASAEVRLAIPEGKLPYIDLPDPYRSKAESTGGEVTLSHRIDGEVMTWQARLVRTEGVLDERSRSLFVVARLPDPYGVYQDQVMDFQPLRFGMFVDAVIVGRQVDGLIALPRDLIRPGNQVWIVDDDDRLQQREVELLRTDGADIFIREGLNAGDRVCLTSLGPVLPGTQVHIVATQRQALPANAGRMEPAGAGA
jgi:RND family efflux transporter MFP subunit